jgi:glycosyltransferase involved in cell wall biosynthesis
MTVALDARVLEHPGLRDGGIGRYTRSLLDALAADGGEPVIELGGLRRPPTPARLAEGWEHLLLGRDARRAGAEVLHSPSVDLATARPGMPYVVTLHDLVPLKQPERYLRTGLKHRLRWTAVRRATEVIAPSQFVAEDATRLLGLADEHLHVVGEAAAPHFAPVSDPRSHLGRLELPERFLLWVGTLDPPDPRKGLGGLVELVRQRDGLPLVLAGRDSGAAISLATPGRVVLTGRVSDDELAALYSAADALVFPSGDEGYGLPPVESLACGTPVAAFAAGSLTEVLGAAEGAVLVEPGDHAALLDAAEALAGATAAALPRTWADVAAETRLVYAAAAR